MLEANLEKMILPSFSQGIKKEEKKRIRKKLEKKEENEFKNLELSAIG